MKQFYIIWFSVWISSFLLLIFGAFYDIIKRTDHYVRLVRICYITFIVAGAVLFVGVLTNLTNFFLQ